LTEFVDEGHSRSPLDSDCSNSDSLSNKSSEDDSSPSAIESILTHEQMQRIKQKVQLKKHQSIEEGQPGTSGRTGSEDLEDFDFSDYSGSDLDDQDLAFDLLDDGDKESQVPQHEERKKTVLKKRENDYFEMLPEGWIEITHSSGMPVYLHKASRVCTFAKPYYLGPGSARQHEVPISAIPCLAYRKQLEKERVVINDSLNLDAERQSNPIDQNEPQLKRMKTEPECATEESQPEVTRLPEAELRSSEVPVELSIEADQVSGLLHRETTKKGRSFSAKVETIKENKKERSLNGLQVRDYCSNVFEFQEITIRKFKTWADRRKHLQLRKLAQRPSLPEGTKLITCPMPKGKETSDTVGRNLRKEFVMNPAGKSSVCILHEFVQHTERVQPKYVFKELENAATPYSATVVINAMQYGIGYGSSKKQAKSEAGN
jgi:microprocessor complex subunit DGCR8